MGSDGVAVILSGLVGAVLTGGTIYATVIRGVMTKKDHQTFCDGKQALVFSELKHIRETQARMDKKIDRILFNGPTTTTASSGSPRSG